MAFEMESALKALITKSKVSDEGPLIAFLEKEGIEDVESFALICEAEGEVAEAIVKKAGYDTTSLRNMVAIKKVWRWARQACEQVAAGSAMPSASAGPPQDRK